MKIKHQLVIGFSLQIVVAVVVLLVVITWMVGNKTEESLSSRAQQQLVSVRDATKSRIEGYFDTLQNQVITFSNDRMIIDSMKEFKQAFSLYKQQTNSSDSNENQLNNYYNSEFGAEYKTRNNNENVDVNSWLSALDNDSVSLQNAFIAVNPHPLGAKDNLVDLNDSSDYAAIHSKFHSHIRDFQSRFGFYDIFLVDPTNGDIIYSVFKELDYSTSLINGPFANTGIGEAFKKANALASPEETVITDFAPYPPSYMDMASFIASPIFDNGVKIGILIFQMPISKISQIMTHNDKWRDVGLGDSGETYLVGDDHLIKNESRFFVEDRDSYLEALKESGLSDHVIKKINYKNSSIGLQPVDSIGVKKALSGTSGFQIFPDYRKVPVLSAFSPVNIKGLNWVIMAEIDEEEAFRAVSDIQSALVYYSLGVGLVVVVLAALSGFLMANRFSSRLTRMISIMKPMTNGDLTQKFNESKNDELGEFAHAFNYFIDSLKLMVGELSQVAANLTNNSNTLKDNSSASLIAISSQQEETEQLATAMTEMQATLAEVATNVESTSAATNEIADVSVTAKEATDKNLKASKSMASFISETSSSLSNLEKDSDAIGSVLDVIKQIADQTNLLALNAAIEAARAGEQGRGFAVVADEVRTLASRTQTSTEEIQAMIESLQTATKKSVESMALSAKQAIESETLSGKTYSILTEIDESINNINDMATQIATASEEQVAVAEDVNRSVVQINDLCVDSVSKTNDTSQMANEINLLSDQISTLVKQFKI
ncbi:MAG: methyl-accepting chemotaxis protein [Kangiellaceae bacterium]